LDASHGYIKNGFDVHEWAAPEFAEATWKSLQEDEDEELLKLAHREAPVLR
jgi:hypothetical protein